MCGVLCMVVIGMLMYGGDWDIGISLGCCVMGMCLFVGDSVMVTLLFMGHVHVIFLSIQYTHVILFT